MKFEVYCDESRPDLLASTSSSADFMIIGSLWLEAEKRGIFKQAIHSLRNKHKIGGEFKWQKVSPSREGFYRELMDWFFERYSALRFRCIAVSREKVNLLPFHDNDQELGFYKFYYQVLHHWILDYNEYAVFSDFKSNRKPDRLHVMQQCLNAANLSSRISTVQMIRSKESILLQLVDVLTGAVSAKLNQSSHSGTAKARLITHIEEQLQNPIGHTAKSEQKFNVFVIDLGGGW